MLLGTLIAYVAIVWLAVSMVLILTESCIVNEFGYLMVLIAFLLIASMVGSIEKYPYRPNQKVQVTNVSNSMYQTKNGVYTYNRNHMTFKNTSAKNSYIIIKRPQKAGFGDIIEYMVHTPSVKKTLYLNSHDQHKLLQH